MVGRFRQVALRIKHLSHSKCFGNANKLELKINDEVAVEKTYKFNYLKNSHVAIAEIVKRVE